MTELEANTPLHVLARQAAAAFGTPEKAYEIFMDAVQTEAKKHAARTLSQSRKGKPLTEKELARNNNASAIAAEKKLAKRKPPETE